MNLKMKTKKEINNKEDYIGQKQNLVQLITI